MNANRLNASLVVASCAALLALAIPYAGRAETNPATEPTVLAVSKAMPAVVNINTERILKRTVRDPYDDLFNNFFGGAMRPPRTLRQKVQSLGSGFLVDPAGFIITNEHVVERAADLKISVTTADGKTYEARYIAGAAESDLALIKIEGKDPFPFISPNDLSPTLLGQTVLVLGNPLGYGSSVARGIVSAKGRTISVGETEYKDLVQTDAAINPGNSGGPLVDLNGRLVGVSSVKMAYTPQGVPTQGLGFAITGEVVKAKLEQFKKIAAAKPVARKSEARGLAGKYFGIQLQDFTPALRETFGEETGAGILIADVEPNSPAQEAGLKQGLVIVQVGRYAVESVKQVEDLLEQIGSGAAADFTVGTLKRVRGQNFWHTQVVSVTARKE